MSDLLVGIHLGFGGLLPPKVCSGVYAQTPTRPRRRPSRQRCVSFPSSPSSDNLIYKSISKQDPYGKTGRFWAALKFAMEAACFLGSRKRPIVSGA